jgi:hypothetical protein
MIHEIVIRFLILCIQIGIPDSYFYCNISLIMHNLILQVSDVKREKELAERQKNNPMEELSQDHLVRKLFSKFRKGGAGGPTPPGGPTPAATPTPAKSGSVDAGDEESGSSQAGGDSSAGGATAQQLVVALPSTSATQPTTTCAVVSETPGGEGPSKAAEKTGAHPAVPPKPTAAGAFKKPGGKGRWAALLSGSAPAAEPAAPPASPADSTPTTPPVIHSPTVQRVDTIKEEDSQSPVEPTSSSDDQQKPIVPKQTLIVPSSIAMPPPGAAQQQVDQNAVILAAILEIRRDVTGEVKKLGQRLSALENRVGQLHALHEQQQTHRGQHHATPHHHQVTFALDPHHPSSSGS